MRTPPGADAMARLHPIMVRYYALGADKRMSDEVAALIQHYGDERAAAAIGALDVVYDESALVVALVAHMINETTILEDLRSDDPILHRYVINTEGAIIHAKREAREAAIEEAAQIIAPWLGEGHKLTKAIRALAAKPGSKS